MDLLNEGLEKLKLTATAEMRERLDIFKSEIELFNPTYKLVGYEEEDDLIIRHFLDCLADLGSGAGFPGIILAIMLDKNEVVLIERMKRRVDFLRNVILRCKLTNVRIIDRDVKEVNEHFDVVTCRAFHPIYDIIKDVDRIMKKDGAFMAYKGQRSYVEAELSDLVGYTRRFDEIKVPFLDEPRMICTLKREK